MTAETGLIALPQRRLVADMGIFRRALTFPHLLAFQFGFFGNFGITGNCEQILLPAIPLLPLFLCVSKVLGLLVLKTERRLHLANLNHVARTKLPLAQDFFAVDLELYLVFRSDEIFVVALADQRG